MLQCTKYQEQHCVNMFRYSGLFTMNIGYIPYTGVLPSTQKYCYSLRRVVVYLMQDTTRMFKKVCYVETPFIPGGPPPTGDLRRNIIISLKQDTINYTHSKTGNALWAEVVNPLPGRDLFFINSTLSVSSNTF